MEIDEINKIIEKAKTESEKQVAKLFVDMGFNLLDVDSDIRKGDKQPKKGDIDVVCIFEDYIFLIEVNGEKNAGSKKINDFFSKWSDPDNLKLILEKYNLGPLIPVFLYFELTKKSDNIVSPATEHFTKKDFNIIIYADDLEYFQKYVNKIGSWAKNDLLYFIGINNKEDIREIDAIQFHIRDIVVFSFVQRVDILLNSCYVSRRRDRQEGYQRTLSESRIKSVAKAIMDGRGLTFPNSILINTPTLKESISSPTPRPIPVKIKFPTGYCSCRIIDGQHRLLGFSQIPDDIQKRFFLPVVAVQNLNPKDEIQTFVDINSKQKSVDQNLILLLISGFEWDKSKYEKEYRIKIAVDVARKLNAEYFHGNIYFGHSDESRGSKITLSTMVSALKKNNHILDDFIKTYKIVSNVFMYLSMYLAEYSFRSNTYFGQNKGIRVLFRLLRLFQRNQAKGNVNVSLEDFFKDLSGIMDLDMTKKLNTYYGEAGVNLGASDLIEKMQQKHGNRYEKMKSDLVSLR